MDDERKKKISLEMLDNPDILMRSVEDYTFELWAEQSEQDFPEDPFSDFPHDVASHVVELWQNDSDESQFCYRDEGGVLKLTSPIILSF